jgi:hypothetical protein
VLLTARKSSLDPGCEVKKRVEKQLKVSFVNKAPDYTVSKKYKEEHSFLSKSSSKG